MDADFYDTQPPYSEQGQTPYDANRILTASEIGSYLYCNRSWWLGKVGGYQPVNVEQLEMGVWVHEEHFETVEEAREYNRTGQYLMIAAAALIVLWILSQVLS